MTSSSEVIGRDWNRAVALTILNTDFFSILGYTGTLTSDTLYLNKRKSITSYAMHKKVKYDKTIYPIYWNATVSG